jgi:hypothetical protein
MEGGIVHGPKRYNHDKARVFMESFFPKMADPDDETPTQQRE